MKWTPTICLLLLVTPLFPQDAVRLPAKSREPDPAGLVSPAALALQLTAGCSSEREKVTAIFRWITDHISYYRPDPRRTRKKKETMAPAPDFSTEPGVLPSLDERVALQVLRTRSAVCEGYARLFKSLCDHAGIRAQVLTGYARTRNGDKDARFRSNHTWNAVCIDQAWYLLDVTWASGYISLPSGEFVRQYDAYYFLTSPDKFIQHHYPDDPRWALLEEPPVIPEFRHTPFRQKSFTKYSITDFYPAKGIIETELGDTVRLELETFSAERNFRIAPDSLWEEGTLPQNPAHAFVQPDKDAKGARVTYNFPVSTEKTQWLYVMYNNDAVLRYRLQVRSPFAGNQPK